MTKPTVAVCAVQGAFAEHEQRLRALGCEALELRRPSDLARPFDALVLPGGESTVQAKLLYDLGLFEPLRTRIKAGMPVLGTCAGLILLAERIEDATGDLAGLDCALAAARTGVTGFGTLPVTVRRNGYGRQLGSFHARAPFGGEAERAAGTAPTIPLTFIRAPFITEVRTEAGAEVLARTGGRVVAARAGNQLGVAFHPELDEGEAVYEMFLGML